MWRRVQGDLAAWLAGASVTWLLLAPYDHMPDLVLAIPALWWLWRRATQSRTDLVLLVLAYGALWSSVPLRMLAPYGTARGTVGGLAERAGPVWHRGREPVPDRPLPDTGSPEPDRCLCGTPACSSERSATGGASVCREQWPRVRRARQHVRPWPGKVMRCPRWRRGSWARPEEVRRGEATMGLGSLGCPARGDDHGGAVVCAAPHARVSPRLGVGPLSWQVSAADTPVRSTGSARTTGAARSQGPPGLRGRPGLPAARSPGDAGVQGPVGATGIPAPTATPLPPTATAIPQGPGPTGTTYCTGIFDWCPDMSGLMNAVFGGIFSSIANLFGSAWDAVTGPFAAALIATPNFAQDSAWTAFQTFVSTLQVLWGTLFVALFVCGLFARYLEGIGAGSFQPLLSVLGRATFLTAFLALYNPIMATWVFPAENGLAQDIYNANITGTSGGFTAIGQALDTISTLFSFTSVLNLLILIVALVVCILCVVVRDMGLGILAALYIVGPLALITWLSPQLDFIARWWFRTMINLLLWPVGYALALKVGSALAGRVGVDGLTGQPGRPGLCGAAV